MFDRVEQSIRRCSGAADLNDDEVMTLRILSHDDSCQASLTDDTCRCGTMWDLSSTEDNAKLRRPQIQEEPELVAVSPPSTNFSSLLFVVVLETIRTGAMRVVHITVKTEETQRLRIKFVLVLSYLNSNTTCTVLPEFKHNVCQQFALYCPTCAYQHKQVYLSNCR